MAWSEKFGFLKIKHNITVLKVKLDFCREKERKSLKGSLCRVSNVGAQTLSEPLGLLIIKRVKSTFALSACVYV